MRRVLCGILLTLAVGGVVFSGCSPNAIITCGRLDRYMDQCYPACSASFFCETRYDTKLPPTQDLLDECADCLRDSTRMASCADCTVQDAFGSYSCFALLTDKLGAVCAFH